MRFSLFHLPTYREGFSASLNAFYGELTDAVKLADRLGWARSSFPNITFIITAARCQSGDHPCRLGARDENIRLAAGVSLVPLRHPLQVAEDYALVDQLSGGRVDMGVSRGFAPHEFASFGVATGETTSASRRRWRFSKNSGPHSPAIMPASSRALTARAMAAAVQKRIPIWIAASNDPASFERIRQGRLRPADEPVSAVVRKPAREA